MLPGFDALTGLAGAAGGGPTTSGAPVTSTVNLGGIDFSGAQSGGGVSPWLLIGLAGLAVVFMLKR